MLLKGQKNDTIFLFNGDKITGEIKSLDFGKLEFSTDDIGTIHIEWDKISTIHGDKNFEIKYANGMRRFGGLAVSSIPGTAYLVSTGDKNLVKMKDIVEVFPIKETVWSRIEGKIEVGVNYNKANEIFQFSTDFNADYRGKKYSSGIRSSNIYTDQPGRPQTQKSDFNVYIAKYIKNNWYADASSSIERNSELGLDYRILTGIAFGHDLLRGVRNRLSYQIGTYFNQEKGLDTTFTTSSAEGALSVAFQKLKFDSPKLDIYSKATYYPSLTEAGRNRFQYDINTEFEIVSDFYIGIKFYYTYDSQPRNENASDRDYGIRSVMGYKF